MIFSNIKTFPEIKLFSTKFPKIQVEELIDYLVEAAKTPKKTLVENVNIRAMNFAYERVCACIAYATND